MIRAMPFPEPTALAVALAWVKAHPDFGHPAELAYSFGHRPRAIFRNGLPVS